jgi:hypothetical protein
MNKAIYWRTPFGEWFKGELLAITEEGVIVHRTVPAFASYVPLTWDQLDEYERRRMHRIAEGKE